MKPIIYGALLGVLWLTVGLPLTVPSAVVMTVVAQPVTVVFSLGVAPVRFVSVRLTETRRWSR